MKKKKTLFLLTLCCIMIVIGFYWMHQQSPLRSYQRNLGHVSSSHCSDSLWIAQVNNQPILCETWKRAIQNYQNTGKSLSQAEEEAMDNLITIELLFQEAHKNGIKLAPEAGAFRAKIMRQNMGDSAFNHHLIQYKMTQEEYEHQWFRQATIDLYIKDHIENQVKVKEATLKELYQKIIQDTSAIPNQLSFEKSKNQLKTLYTQEKTKLLIKEKVTQLKKSSQITFR